MRLLCTAVVLLLTTASLTIAPTVQAQSKGTQPNRAQRKKAPRKKKPKVHPCNTPDPGWGIYQRWNRNIRMGQLLAPKGGGLTKRGGFDLIVHFHGHEPIRKELVKVGRGLVLVGIDLGTGSGAYSKAFASPKVFTDLIRSVERAMAKTRGRRRTYVRRMALSAWSAGYGAIGQILRQPIAKKIDTVILLDALHAGYSDANNKTIRGRGLASFLSFARSAARGRTFMFQTHSEVQTHGYATTREVSHFMVKKLRGRMRKARRRDRLGLRLVERFDKRGYHVRGYKGDDKPNHCAHIGIFRDVIKAHLRRRWRTPKGYIPKRRKRKR